MIDVVYFILSVIAIWLLVQWSDNHGDDPLDKPQDYMG